MRTHNTIPFTIRFAAIFAIMLATIGCSSSPAGVPAAATTGQAPAKVTASTPASPAAAPTGATAASAAATTSAQAEPQGDLSIAMQDGIVPVLDPMLLTATSKAYSGLVFDNLVGVTDDEKDIAPTGVAEKYEASADLKTWTFYLRKNITFSNGDKLTADDVKFSMQRIMSPNAKAVAAATFRNAIQDIQVVDPYTVKFLLKAPSLTFAVDLSIMTNNGEGQVVPKGYVERNGEAAFQKNPIGSGPYKIAKVDPGNMLQLEARPDYWGGIPKYKTVTFKSIPEPTTAIAALKTGQVDIITMSPDLVQQVKDAGLQVFLKQDYTEAAIIYHDTGNPAYPQTNLKVRQALGLAVNRDELVNAIYQGYAKPFAGGYPQHTASYGYQAVKLPVYDVAKAKQLLAEGGYPNGFSVDLYSYQVSGIANGPLVLQAVAGYWDKIGVKAKIQPIDYNAFRNEKWVGKKSNGAFSGLIAASGNGLFPTSLYQTVSFSKGMMATMSDPKMDQLIQDLATTSSLDAYKAANAKIVQYIDDNQFHLAVAYVNQLFATDKKISDWELGRGSSSMNTRYLVLKR